MAQARRVLVNPNDHEMRYVMYSNARMRPSGLHPPPEYDIGDDISGYGTGKLPLVNPNRDSDVLFRWAQIYDWNADPPTGHIGDIHGRVFNLGDAPEVPENQQPVAQIYPWPGIVDAVMNPAGTGEGYATTLYGGMYGIGGPPDLSGEWFGDGIIQRLYMPDWATKKFVFLGLHGERFEYNGSVPLVSHKDFGAFGVVNKQPSEWWSETWWSGAALVFLDDLDTGDGFGLMSEGWIWSLNNAQLVYGEPITPENWRWMDLAILDNGLGPTPLRLLVLGIDGAEADFVVSTPPVVTPANAVPEAVVTNTTRPKWAMSYADNEGDARDFWQLRLLRDDQYGAGGTNEAQRVTITGTPTGGTFRLVFNGQTTAPIVRNATAAQVQTALEGLINVEVGDVAVTGGPLPGSFVTVTFQGALGKHPLQQMGAIKAFTGGVTPAVTVTTITEGVAGVDPGSSTIIPHWSLDIPMPKARNVTSGIIGSNALGAGPSLDLANDTYRLYARARDTAGQWSEWAMRQFTQNTVPPETPTLLAAPLDDVNGVMLTALASSHPAGAKYYFEFTDTPTDPKSWRYVRGSGEGLDPDVVTHDYVHFDPEPTYGVQRSYRVRMLVEDPWLAGAYSAVATATVTSQRYTVLNTNSLPGASDITVVDVMEWDIDEEVIRGVFQPDFRPDNVVITSENAVKFPNFPLKVRTLDRAKFDAVMKKFRSDDVLLVRDFDGEAHYIMVSDTIKRTKLRARPKLTETTPVRHVYELEFPVHAVRCPLEGPADGELAMLGV